MSALSNKVNTNECKNVSLVLNNNHS